MRPRRCALPAPPARAQVREPVCHIVLERLVRPEPALEHNGRRRRCTTPALRPREDVGMHAQRRRLAGAQRSLGVGDDAGGVQRQGAPAVPVRAHPHAAVALHQALLRRHARTPEQHHPILPVPHHAHIPHHHAAPPVRLQACARRPLHHVA
eukprot:642226-Rhodomonas_salina.1